MLIINTCIAYAMLWLIDLYAELPYFDGPNDHEKTNVGKNEYHFCRVIRYEELTVKISKKSGPLGCVAFLVGQVMVIFVFNYELLFSKLNLSNRVMLNYLKNSL